MQLTLDEIIEQLEDARVLQPVNELAIYRKWIPILRKAFDSLPRLSADGPEKPCAVCLFPQKRHIKFCPNCGRSLFDPANEYCLDTVVDGQVEL